MNKFFDTSIRAGTAGGTMLAIFANIDNNDLIKTAVLAAIGAAVSFCVTLSLKVLIKYFKK